MTHIVRERVLLLSLLCSPTWVRLLGAWDTNGRASARQSSEREGLPPGRPNGVSHRRLFGLALVVKLENVAGPADAAGPTGRPSTTKGKRFFQTEGLDDLKSLPRRSPSRTRTRARLVPAEQPGVRLQASPFFSNILFSSSLRKAALA